MRSRMDQQQPVQGTLSEQRQFKWPPPLLMLSTQQSQSLEQQLPDSPYSVSEELKWSDISSLQTAPLPKQQQKPEIGRQKRSKPRRKGIRRMFIITSLITILSLILCTQSNGQVG